MCVLGRGERGVEEGGTKGARRTHAYTLYLDHFIHCYAIEKGWLVRVLRPSETINQSIERKEK